VHRKAILCATGQATPNSRAAEKLSLTSFRVTSLATEQLRPACQVIRCGDVTLQVRQKWTPLAQGRLSSYANWATGIALDSYVKCRADRPILPKKTSFRFIWMPMIPMQSFPDLPQFRFIDAVAVSRDDE
jgi:hypothetical protein